MVNYRPGWEPSPEDYQRLFAEQNPWHESGEVPETLALPVERSIVPHLAHRLRTPDPRRFQVVVGPRRVGKTTSMYQILKRFLLSGMKTKRLWWLRLDHPLLMQIPLGDLVKRVVHESRATKESPVFIFLDELAYANEWDLWLKTFYDENWPVCIIGSSSSTAILRQRRLESGIGRWEEHYLAPYLFNEFLQLENKQVDIDGCNTLVETIEKCIEEAIDVSELSGLRRRYMLTGGFPELLKMGGNDINEEQVLLESQRVLRADAIERAIYKDIPQTFSIENPMLLERMLYILGAQSATILSPQNICNELDGLGQPTFDKYLSYLERAYLVFCLSNYSGREMVRQKRGRKLYFVDGAVRNAALQRGLAPLKDPTEMGLLLENLTASHLHTFGQHGQIRIFHWRARNDEVDLIIDHPEHALALEIASGEGHSRRGLLRLMERHPQFRNKSYMVAPKRPYVSAKTGRDGIGSICLDSLLLAIGKQSEIEMAKRFGSPFSTPQSVP